MTTDLQTIPQALMDIWTPILENVANGFTLKKQSEEPCAPLNYKTMRQHIKRWPQLSDAYASAELALADTKVEELMDISEEEPPDGMSNADANAWANRQKFRIESRKWFASKISRKWSDKTIVEQTNYVVDIKALLEKREQRLLTLEK